MTSLPRRTLLAAALVLAALTAGLVWAFALRSPGTPERFDLGFGATGLVEEVRALSGDRCVVQVAVYDWINLSRDFPLAEIPQRNDRYRLHGSGDACTALTVAMEATSGHIGFRAGHAGGRWYLDGAPDPGYGCGGLVNDWTPDPI